jgi:hypothetical protein
MALTACDASDLGDLIGAGGLPNGGGGGGLPPTVGVPTPYPYGLLRPILAEASSTLQLGGASYLAGRAVDGDEDTEWASTDEDPDPTLGLTFGGRAYVDAVAIKTWPGSTFAFEVSDDGVRWTRATQAFRSASFAAETYAVQATGRSLRVRFGRPSPPDVGHFSVFELWPYGTLAAGGGGGVGTLPAAEGLVFLGATENLVGEAPGDSLNDVDGHFRLTITLPAATEIQALDLYGLDPTTRARNGYLWSTHYGSAHLLAILAGPGSPLRAARESIATVAAGTYVFDLYADNHVGFFTGSRGVAQLEVLMPGATRTFEVQLP